MSRDIANTDGMTRYSTMSNLGICKAMSWDNYDTDTVKYA